MSTVVCLHSTGLGPFMWGPLAQALGAWGVVCPANRGYAPGEVLHPPAPHTLADEVNHLLNLPALAGVQAPVHLVAHSYGGLVALELARSGRLPVASLCLIEPVLFAALRQAQATLEPGLATEIERLYAVPDFFSPGDDGGDEAWLRRFVDYWNGAGAWDLRMSDKARQAMRRVGWKMSREVDQVTHAARPFGDYALGLPLTVVWGGASTTPARAMAEHLVAANPGAVLEVVPGLGHMGVIEQPLALVPGVLAHLARCSEPKISP